MKQFKVIAILLVLLSPVMADWSTYRADAARTGYSPEPLPATLSLQWTYRARHTPQPAWPREDRMLFDRAFQPVATSDTVFFGGSADGKLYALEAATGKERWTFFTDAAIRFAPVLWKDRVFVASDDGVLYCLAAKTGSVLWRKRGGPRRDMVLGHGRLMSRWPARGGPMILDDVLYFGAGIWTAEGIYLYALEPETGKVKWVNDSSGAIVMEHPHGGNRAKSGVSIQGYLAADQERVFVPTGRGTPAAFDRETGEFLHFQHQGHAGHAAVVADKGFLFNFPRILDPATGGGLRSGLRGSVSPYSGALLPDKMVRAEGNDVTEYKLVHDKTLGTNGSVISTQWKTEVVRKVPLPHRHFSLIVAGSTIVSGGENGISLLDMAAPTQAAASAEVDGKALGLAATHGRLFVSTDKGVIHCFAGTVTANPPTLTPGIQMPADTASATADEIIKRSGVTEGYCLDLGCGDGSLAYALARKTKLHVVAVDVDPEMVALARQRLDKAALYGTRITVIQADLAATPLPNYFANLVVSARALEAGMDPVQEKEAMRVLRPYGGIACVGKTGALKLTKRGPLKGAGEWTHQYGDAGNSGCSDDVLARAPLGMLWFTDLGITMPNRHGRGPAPLFKDGMMIVEGVDGLFGVDSYNGRVVWEHRMKGILAPYNQEHLLGTAGTHGNMCVADDSVFVRHKDRCLRIDLRTGEKQQEYVMPGARWGFIACDGGILFGTRADTNYVPRYLYGRSDMSELLTQSEEFSAYDRGSGRRLWSYKAERSIRHNAIAIGNGSVFIIDSTLIDTDRLKRLGMQDPLESTLLCLDAGTGKVRWQQTNDVYGTTLVLSAQYNTLLMCYQYSQRSFQFKSEAGDRLTGFNASTGDRVWDTSTDKRIKYVSRPLINGQTIYAQPSAWDLLTGEPKQDYIMQGRQAGGCGNISGSRFLMLYRSGPLSYIDLTQEEKVNQSYGPMRPGCWINAIPAGGLVLMPDATDLCKCSYLMKVSVGLQPM